MSRPCASGLALTAAAMGIVQHFLNNVNDILAYEAYIEYVKRMYMNPSLDSVSLRQAIEGGWMVQTLLTMTVRAPTAVPAEPWQFVVVQDKALLKQISDKARASMLALMTELHGTDGSPRGGARWCHHASLSRLFKCTYHWIDMAKRVKLASS